MVVFCGEAFDVLPGDPEFGSDGAPELSPEVEPEVPVDAVPVEAVGDEPFATVVEPLVEVAIPELVVPVEVAIPEVAVPAEGAAVVLDGFVEFPVEEPPASAVPLSPPPPPPPPQALNTTLPPSAVRQPRN
ncbi:hypothetical protein HDG34_001538 [Paraburkholderia sp. HC6.4b]|nr:hypothetical protein [Paraburkholderia sp. HC6.4b]MBB5453637.1 hypothetical protein [Paraburkholderia sp. Kb1A]